MQKSEANPPQQHAPGSQVQEIVPEQPHDLFEQLMKEGKQALDNIPVIHSLSEDSKNQPGQKLENEQPPEQSWKKNYYSKEPEINAEAESRIPVDLDERGELQNLLSMGKKSSRLVIGCNCIKSKCTKNYCQCFTQARKCNQACKCTGCENQGEIQKKYRSVVDAEQSERMCNCKKSNCLKKYCECFNSGMRCTTNCKCEECKNGEDDLECQISDADGEEGKEETKKNKSPEEIAELNAKIDQIARIVPSDQHPFVLSFLEYWLS